MKTTPCTDEEPQASEPVFSFHKAPRCGSKTRSGAPCKSPAIRTKHRCRMHGGKGSGAHKGNKNALKHGYTTQQSKDKLKEIRDKLKEARKFVNQF